MERSRTNHCEGVCNSRTLASHVTTLRLPVPRYLRNHLERTGEHKETNTHPILLLQSDEKSSRFDGELVNIV